MRQDAYPSLGSTAWLLAGALLSALLLALATVALFPGWPQIVAMAVPTELAMIGAIAWAVRKTGLPWRRALGLRPLPFATLPPLALVLVGSVTVFSEMYVIVQRLVPVPPEFEALLRDLLRIGDATDLALTVLVAVVVAPVLEEALFRGVVLEGLARRRGPRSATLWTAGFFAFFHFYNPWQILPTFFLGLVLAWVVLTTRTLWASIVLHAAFNGVSLAIFAIPLPSSAAPAPVLVMGLVFLLLVGSAALVTGLAWIEGMTGGGAFAVDYPPPEEGIAGEPPEGELGSGAEGPPAARA